ncbi:L domain-like protein [Anaeromyces robustus]|uniref:L domain-like protein n=1 Tax=Anaeromyces robustus TaxID=1754192 RepID=A0A1Y1X1N0_9FUNG|nr:L domain-like protein [Anaeromyces robustus]|eukprot:ORX79717.1 L domain-like protein [Anaeromyces robustus]
MYINGKKFGILLSVIGSVLASAKDECGFVNTLLGKSTSNDCCNEGYPYIKCSNNHITYINLSGRKINKELPKTFGSMKKLVSLNLSNTGIYGSIPSDLENLESLVEFNLGYNEITEIPDNIDSLKHLKILNVTHNKIKSYQKNTNNLKVLTDLDLSNNEIEDEILGDISNGILRVLNLSNNNISGSIPESLYNITSLVDINLSNNIIDGSIMEDISKITNLRNLDLGNNRLSGDIPTESFEKLKNMAHLNLEKNIGLSGKIPSITYDSIFYTCKFTDTNLCYSNKKNTNCEYSSYRCDDCKENAQYDGSMCKCKENYTGLGYILCSESEDTNLNKGSESGSLARISFSTFIISSLILIVSYLLI